MCLDVLFLCAHVCAAPGWNGSEGNEARRRACGCVTPAERAVLCLLAAAAFEGRRAGAGVQPSYLTAVILYMQRVEVKEDSHKTTTTREPPQ